MVDYDLVVIGSSPAGLYAAAIAASLKARVALVDQGMTGTEQGDRNRSLWPEISHTLGQLHHARNFGLLEQVPPIRQPDLAALSQAIDTALATAQTTTLLASQGIEVISASGEFYRKPSLGFTVNGRSLRSRAYLLALEARPVIPAIDGLAATGYLTAATSLSLELESLNHLVMIGADPAAVELAQTVVRLGKSVTLVVKGDCLLPGEDPEAAQWMQAQLEAEGVQVLLHTPVTQVRKIDDQKWVQAGNQAIEADEIVLATGQQPNLEGLNLEAAIGQWPRSGLPLSPQCRTPHPRIYACPGLVGDRYCPQVALAEARMAVRNALFWPLARIDYRSLPRVVFSTPEVASLGLTEPQAVQQYGKAVWVLRHPFKTLPKAQMAGEASGFCKLIVRSNGAIVGASLVGLQASELIGPIALAMQQRLKIQALAELVLPTPTLSEILSQTAAEWQRLRWQRSPWLQGLRDAWFELRRSGT